MDSSNKRIVKNTGLLYVRQFFLILVNLYAVRVTLEALGVVDYGIFNVIASVVWSMSVLTGAMTSATQRFLSYHLGQNDHESYSRSFSMFVISYGLIAVAVVIVGEILCYFFVYKWLNIPADKLSASMWTYQAILVSFIFNMLSIPYTSSIVANERMEAFAWFSIVDGVLKLAIAFVIMEWPGDRLKLYGCLFALISIIVFLLSVRFCHAKFKYCRYIWQWNKSVFKELFSYLGWNMFGSVSSILASYGQNILLNIYFGPVINAAKAIADRIQHVINGFSVNLYMAVSPQIIKSYASEAKERAMNLVIKSSRISFLLIFVIAFPLICNMSGLLRIWLGNDGASTDMTQFSQLTLIYCMILALEPPISRIIQATGRIKKYQLSVGVITMCYIPVAILVLWLGCDAVFTLIVLMCVMVVAQAVRVLVAHRQVGLDLKVYSREVLWPIFKISVVGIPVYMLFLEHSDGSALVPVMLETLIAGVAGLFIGGVLGLEKSDRRMAFDFLKSRFNKS